MIAADVVDLDRMSFQGNLDPDVCPAQDTISGEFKQRYRMNDIHTMYPSRQDLDLSSEYARPEQQLSRISSVMFSSPAKSHSLSELVSPANRIWSNNDIPTRYDS
jgi:hypothetical protein